MSKKEIEQKAIAYLKENKQLLFERYLDGYSPLEEKIAYFTAGPSGAGKTEYAQQLTKAQNDLIHLDIDRIREFFSTIGYDGTNSDLYQRPASRGIQYLFDEIMKREDLSLILDSNLSHLQVAEENIKKLLKREYRIELYYIYNDLEKCSMFAKKRELATRRIVPEDVLFLSAINSRKTTYEIKKIFHDKIILNIMNREEGKVYENINCDEFDRIVPEFKLGDA